MAEILLIDSISDVAQRLRSAGHHVASGTLGYLNGTPNLQVAPHEFDLIAIDLWKPACFDITKWGPGGNDNFRCRLVNEPKEAYVIKDRSKSPVHQIIYESQLGPPAPGSFSPNDVFRAIGIAGVPLLIFLNHEWLRHIGREMPNFCELSWAFGDTRAKKLAVQPLYSALTQTIPLPDIKLPALDVIRGGPYGWKDGKYIRGLEGYTIGPAYPTYPLITNAVGDVFSQVSLVGNGAVWLLPQYTDNSIALLRFAAGLDSPKTLTRQLMAALDATDPSIAVPPEAARSHSDGPLTAAKVPVPSNESDVAYRDVFISHASEDKDAIARPLAERLISFGLSVWFDEYELTLGDSLRRKIDEGLAHSAYGAVILSSSFFEKDWPQKELDGLVALERDTKRILPIWHNVTRDEVTRFSAILADRYAGRSERGVDTLAQEILKVVRSVA